MLDTDVQIKTRHKKDIHNSQTRASLYPWNRSTSLDWAEWLLLFFRCCCIGWSPIGRDPWTWFPGKEKEEMERESAGFSIESQKVDYTLNMWSSWNWFDFFEIYLKHECQSKSIKSTLWSWLRSVWVAREVETERSWGISSFFVIVQMLFESTELVLFSKLSG